MRHSRAATLPSPFGRLAGLLIAVACAAPASHAAGSWVHDPSDFPSSPLCKPAEVTLWACEARRETFALCAGKGADGHPVTIQYRVQDRHGKVVLRYPEPLRAPSSAFAYLCSANGDARVEFTVGKTRYSLVDPLRDVSFISVAKDGKQRTHLTCKQGNQSLQLNDTIALMRALRVAPPR